MISAIARYRAAHYSSLSGKKSPRTAAEFNSTESSEIVSISPDAYAALRKDAYEQRRGRSEEERAIDQLLDRINSDPEFAEEMAYLYSHSPDVEVVDLGKDSPPSDGSVGAGTYKAIEGYSEHGSEFSAKAQYVLQQRQRIYAEMKTRSATGATIFLGLMQFNKSLPGDYLRAAGLDRLVAKVDAEEMDRPS